MVKTSPIWAGYLVWMLVSTLAFVAMVGAFNVGIDSLGVFGSPRITGLNAHKPYLDHHREFARWRAAQRICPSAGIFGNSRAEIGLDPENALFAARGLSAFNHSIPGERAHMSYRQIHWLKAAGCMPKVIILGVEFFDFLGREQPPSPMGLEPDARPQLDHRFIAESVFSISGLRDSLGTVLLQRARYPAILTERGFNPLQQYIPEVEQDGHYALFRQRALENAQKWVRKPKRLNTAGGEILQDVQAVDAILTLGADADSTVYVIIYPYHAQIRLMLERLHLGMLFADWKKSIVTIAARHSTGGAKVEVWDFSGISPEISEAIPGKGDQRTRLRYYWEAGHFKKALGNRVISRILGEEQAFGIKLNADNIDRWLAEDRTLVKALLATPSPLLAEVDDILSQAAKR